MHECLSDSYWKERPHIRKKLKENEITHMKLPFSCVDFSPSFVGPCSHLHRLEYKDERRMLFLVPSTTNCAHEPPFFFIIIFMHYPVFMDTFVGYFPIVARALV